MRGQLAADEIERLHAVGALVEHRDTEIAGILLDTMLADVAVPAIDLDAELRRFMAEISEQCLDHRGH